MNVWSSREKEGKKWVTRFFALDPPRVVQPGEVLEVMVSNGEWEPWQVWRARVVNQPHSCCLCSFTIYISGIHLRLTST